ncbi:MAG: hypothetical protein Ct9H300mP28_13620 [Pseudomonadota bacterium]|nr:MAG: hypothetical protein Ct9H300mP28_13620 [Pseudomonadota bacterium]
MGTVSFELNGQSIDALLWGDNSARVQIGLG